MIKKIRQLIVWTLRTEARLVLKRYQPKIIGVSGNVGKTSTKEAIYSLLKASNYDVRRSVKSYNSEIGIPLTILGLPNAWSNPLKWLSNILRGFWLLLSRQPYPKWLVLEVGADRPGDIAEIVSWLKFDLVVMTRLPDQPVHSEFFPSPEALIAEKLLLPQSLTATGIAILNADDKAMMRVAPELKAKVISFGLNPGATIRASQVHLLTAPAFGLSWSVPLGLAFKVDYAGHTVPFKITGPIGEHQLVSLLAAISVGVALEINLVELTERLDSLRPPPGRLRVLPGIKQTLILDDTYNSSPAALAGALTVLGELRTPGRKIAVIGDMLELGMFTIDAHREAGAWVARTVDVLVTVGVRAKFISEEAAKKRFGKRRLYHFDSSIDAGKFLQTFIEPGDVILAKGSQSMRLERVVEEIMAEPDQKNSLLCRQEPEWLARL